MTIHYHQPHDGLIYEMVLIGIEFDDETVHCVPLNCDIKKDEYYINIKYIEIPDKKVTPMKVISDSKPRVHSII